jgi:hypothetical protein
MPAGAGHAEVVAVVAGALAAIDAVDWAQVRHCYGAAGDLPGWLRATLSDDADERHEALMEARNLVNHQGGRCEASLHVVPFLVEAALHAPADRAAFVYWLAWSCDPQEDARRDPSGFLGQVRDAVAARFGELAPLLEDSDPAVRRAMVMLAAACPRDAVEAVADLRELDDPDEYVRADMLTALAFRFADWPGLDERLRRSLSDASAVVRYQAGRVMMRRCGPPFAEEAVDAVADVLARHGEPDGQLDAIESLCHGPDPDPDPAQSSRTGLVLVWGLDPLVQDPDMALRAAGRVVAWGGPHAGYGARLAGQVVGTWRDREAPAAAILLGALHAAPEATQAVDLLRRVTVLATRMPAPGQELLSAAAEWAASAQPAVAGAAIAALARLGDRTALARAAGAPGPASWPSWALAELAGVFAGEAAPLVLPVIRERLAGLSRHRPDRDEARPLFEALQALGHAAGESVPELTSLLERRVLLADAIGVLRVLGTAALQAAPALTSIAASPGPMFVRLRAAAAHCSVTGDEVLARQAAAALLDDGRLDTAVLASLSLLGPVAADCAPLVQAYLDTAADPGAAARSTADRDQAAVTLWRITRDAGRCIPLLAAAVGPSHLSGLDAIRALREIGVCPPACVPVLRQITESPTRLLLHTWRQPPRLDDDLLRDAARELLELRPQLDPRRGPRDCLRPLVAS